MSVSPTAGGFDALAPGYDADFGDNPIGRWMRQRTWDRIDARFASGSHILEIGCGTGIDMVRLAERGHRVTAVDLSPAMAAEALNKAVARKLQSRATVLCCDLSSGPLPGDVAGGAPYDGLLSNFGALNCVDDLPGLLRRLQRLVNPGAPFLACLMTRPCPWEIAWFFLRLKPGEAFRRYRRGGVGVNLGGHPVRTHYRSAAGYCRIFSDGFRVDRLQALGVVVPPPFLRGLAEKYPLMFRLAARIETLLAHRRPFSLAGDHTLFEMTGKECRR